MIMTLLREWFMFQRIRIPFQRVLKIRTEISGYLRELKLKQSMYGDRMAMKARDISAKSTLWKMMILPVCLK